MALLRPEVEAASPGDLRAREEAMLREILPLAARSVLYRGRWEPGSIRTLDDLPRLPYLSGADLREAWRHPRDEVLAEPDARLWFATSGTTGLPKWTPYGLSELRMFEDVVRRVYHMLAGGDPFRLVIFGTPAPFISDAGAYALLFASIAAGFPAEYLITSPTEAEAALRLMSAHRPDAVVGFPSLLLRIAEALGAEAPRQAREAWRHERSWRALAGVVATRLIAIQPRHVFRPKVGLFGGEPLAPYRKALADAWGLRPYELYAMTEYPCFHVECPEGSGIHVWADWCVPELIPLSELDRDTNRPAAHHLLDARAGEVGEFVFTSFGRTLPLVRYRTGDVIEVVDVARCGCGRTHPRIRVRGRRDDLVNLGLIRFSTAELERHLATLPLRDWQLRITRHGYKPAPLLLVVPLDPARADVVGEARRALDAIDVLRVGVEAGLVLPPEVRVVGEIEEVRTWSGKRRRVVDET